MAINDGSNFGPYRILGRLGRGGMATVYRAYEPGLDRTVALKVLPEDSLDNDPAVQRFKLEAKAVARLVHPNIVPVHAFGIEAATSTPWMALQLVEGGSLAGVLAEGPVPPRRALGFLRGIATALDHAHAEGVLHRDVKPQNVLVARGDHVYLADFGLARMLEASAVLSVQGTVLGTPAYMAPEQALGQSPDHRCDIYALGIIAYQMFTGSVPFTADTPLAILMKHVREPIPIPEMAEPVLRPLLKALAKNRDDRWPTASAFVDALEQGLGQGVGSSDHAEAPTVPTVRPAAHAAGEVPSAITAPGASRPPSSSAGRPNQSSPEPSRLESIARTEPEFPPPQRTSPPRAADPGRGTPGSPPPPRVGARLPAGGGGEPPFGNPPREAARPRPAAPAAAEPERNAQSRVPLALLAGLGLVAGLIAVVLFLRSSPAPPDSPPATTLAQAAPIATPTPTPPRPAPTASAIATLEIRSAMPGARATVDDGAPIALPGDVRLTPGKHLVELTRPGCTTSRQWVQVEAGERRRMSVDLGCATPAATLAPTPALTPTPPPISSSPAATTRPSELRPGESRAFADGAYSWIPAGSS